MKNINITINELLKNTIIENPFIGHSYAFPHFNTKYDLDLIISEILYILKTGISWRDLRSSINWSSLYFHHRKFIIHNIYKLAFDNILSLYISKIKNINGLLIDSSFFQNKFGRNKIARNKFFKNKNCCKVSIISDLHGIPFSILTKEGNFHDATIFEDHKSDIDHLSPLLPTNKVIFFMADKAYHSKNISNYFNEKNIKVLIPPKKNKTKNVKQFTLKQHKLYKNRLLIEHLFKDIKRFKRLNMIFDANHSTFLGFIYLALTAISINKINNILF